MIAESDSVSEQMAEVSRNEKLQKGRMCKLIKSNLKITKSSSHTFCVHL